MMAGQFGVFAQFERDLISERTKAALERVRARGIKLGKQSSIPQEIVERIVRARDRGESWRQIAARLQADAVPTGQGGRRWYASSVRSVYVRAMTGKAPR